MYMDLQFLYWPLTANHTALTYHVVHITLADPFPPLTCRDLTKPLPDGSYHLVDSYMGHSMSNQHKKYLTLTNLDETWFLQSVCWDIHP